MKVEGAILIVVSALRATEFGFINILLGLVKANTISKNLNF